MRRVGYTKAESVFEHPDEAIPMLERVCGALCDYMLAVREAGCDAVFHSINGAIMPPAERGIDDAIYRTFVRPYEIRMAEAMAGMVRVLHVHGSSLTVERVVDYPFEALSVSDRLKGNPTLTRLRGMTDRCLMGGIDESSVIEMSLPEVRAQVRDAVAQAGRTNFILSPGSTIPTQTPWYPLKATGETVATVRARRAGLRRDRVGPSPGPRGSRTDGLRSRSDQLTGPTLLHRMGEPADHPPRGEHHERCVGRQTQRVGQGGECRVHVGRRAGDPCAGAQGRTHGRRGGDRSQQRGGAYVAERIQRVTETVQAFAARKHGTGFGLGSTAGDHAFELRATRHAGLSVQRPRQGREAGQGRRGQRRAGGCGDPHGERRRVQLVVGDEHQRLPQQIGLVRRQRPRVGEASMHGASARAAGERVDESVDDRPCVGDQRRGAPTETRRLRRGGGREEREAALAGVVGRMSPGGTRTRAGVAPRHGP